MAGADHHLSGIAPNARGTASAPCSAGGLGMTVTAPTSGTALSGSAPREAVNHIRYRDPSGRAGTAG